MNAERTANPPADVESQDSLKSRYSTLEFQREPYLTRARACAAITIPSLVPPKGHTPHSSLPTPYQALGARGVNTIASKLLLTLLPPNQPCFKLTMDDAIREQLGAKVGDAEKALNVMERRVAVDIETSSTRPQAFALLKHLIVAGNVLMNDDRLTGLRVYPLTQYVVQRDPAGNPLWIILREDIAPAAVPESIRAEALAAHKQSKQSAEKTLELYTGVQRVGDRMKVWQEVCGIRVPGTEGDYPVDKCPWRPLRMIIVDGEDYGRSYVEEFIGDLKSLELLTKSMVLAAVAASKIVFLVNPNGMTKDSDIEEAEGGDVRIGREEDVTVLNLDKRGDFATVEQRIQKLTESLSYAFLLNSAIQRNGERVTAEEIRYMANELETNLGGIYSSLSQEFQLPLVVLRMAKLEAAGRLPNLPKGAVRPMITTGLDAIGRGNDFEKLRAFVGFLAETFGPEQTAAVLRINEAANRAAAGIGIEPDGLVKTEDEMAEEAAASQEAALQEAAIGPTINQMGQAATTGTPS